MQQVARLGHGQLGQKVDKPDAWRVAIFQNGPAQIAPLAPTGVTGNLRNGLSACRAAVKESEQGDLL